MGGGKGHFPFSGNCFALHSWQSFCALSSFIWHAKVCVAVDWSGVCFGPDRVSAAFNPPCRFPCTDGIIAYLYSSFFHVSAVPGQWLHWEYEESTPSSRIKSPRISTWITFCMLTKFKILTLMILTIEGTLRSVSPHPDKFKMRKVTHIRRLRACIACHCFSVNKVRCVSEGI